MCDADSKGLHMTRKTKTKRVALGYGRGAVELLDSGAWRWQGTIDGKRASITRPSQSEAIAAAEVALQQGSKPSVEQTVAEAAEAWRAIAVVGRRGATVQGYAWALDVIVDELGPKPVAELTRASLRGVLAAWTKHYGAGSIAKLRSVLGRVLDYCVDAEWIAASPMPPKTPGAPKAQRPTRHLMPADFATVRRFLVTDHTTLRAAFLTMLLAGLRPGEVRALRWDCVDLPGARLHVRRSVERDDSGAEHVVDDVKTSRYGDEGKRSIPLPPDLVAVLRRQLDEQHAAGMITPYVFADEHGAFLSRYVIEHGARAIARDTDTRLISPNGYRHTFLSMLSDSGLPLAVQKRLAGHRETSTVLATTYTHDMRGDDVDTTPYLGAVVEIGGPK
jgi:integrase